MTFESVSHSPFQHLLGFPYTVRLHFFTRILRLGLCKVIISAVFKFRFSLDISKSFVMAMCTPI